MMKRAIALFLCLITLLLCVTACSKNEDDKGAYIRLYLSEPIYDFDPLQAFDNANDLQIVSLLFSGLFYADEKGKVKKDLVDDYEYIEDKDEGRYFLRLELKETNWSDGVQLNSMHVQYAFRRLFASDVSHPAVALLYDIKNARAIAAGDASVDDLQVTAVNTTTVEIEFEYDIDVDAFLKVLCSPALYPLRDDIVEFNADWAKKPTTMVCSGPFMLRRMDYTEKDGFILERNSYYMRDRQKDDLDEYVTPFRLIADFTTPIEQQLANYNTGEKGSLYFLGNIPVAGRVTAAFAELLEKGDLTDAPSTHMYYLNQNAVIGGKKLFADAAVRQALSLALDRESIAQSLVFAKPADGIVPPALREHADTKDTFREEATQSIAVQANMDMAKSLLQAAGIVPSQYAFTITVPAYDTDHIAAAELAKAAWGTGGLGFNVTVKKLGVEKAYTVDDKGVSEFAGYYNDLYKSALDEADFEIISIDAVSTGVDAFSYLAPYAAAFSGNALEMDTSINPDYALTPHITGYFNLAYDFKIEQAFVEKDQDARAALLHEAEAMLLNDMPVIPVVYNQNFSLAAKPLGDVEANFFCTYIFTETSLSDHWEIAIAEGFIEQKEETEEETVA